MRHVLLLSILALCAGAPHARAAEADRRAAVDGKQLRAIPAGDAPAIDGVLDDPVWASATFADDFRQKIPTEGGIPSRRTEVAFAYDADALYVAARMYATGPDDVQAVMTRRDESGSAERIIVSLDTFRDRRTAYSFALTAAGVRVDWYHPSDSEYDRDHSWNPVWEGATAVHDDRWTAEMRIPFSQLRFSEAERQLWGVNLNRYRPQDNEDVFWIVVPKDRTAWSSYFGELVGIEGIQPSRRLELMPYVAGDVTLTSASLVDPDDPFTDEAELGGRAGLDLKMGLGPNLTLDATFNPDFGQVEADPAVVNLTQFESFFTEQRPFFTEGSQLLRGNGPQYFYSRRIGQPRGGVDDPDGELDYVDYPQATRILGAAKVTGRLRSGTSIGALTAVTQKTYADVYDLDADVRDRVAVEPLTGFGVFRVQQEVGANASVLGLSLTSVYRHLDDGLELQRPRQAYTGGGDWNLRLAGGDYTVGGFVGFSAINGEPAVITALQRSSTHYFQRPDQDHVELDLDATWLSGWAAQSWASRTAGAWTFNTGVNVESVGFDLNDVGLLSAGDEVVAWFDGAYRDVRPGDVLQDWGVGFSAWENWNLDAVRRPGGIGAHAAVTWKNFMHSFVSGEVFTAGQNDIATRGGPLMGEAPGWFAHADTGSMHSGRTLWSVFANVWDRDTGTSGVNGGGTLQLQPYDSWKLSIGPRVSRLVEHRQYVTTIDDPTATATFGARYLFAEVERSELAVPVRVQVAFTPTLSLDLYAEPFASSGAYDRFAELPEPRSRELAEYDDVQRDPATGDVIIGDLGVALDNPDFTVLSLRSTAVLRWEWSPGSTLFVVWQQNRGELLPDGTPAGAGALGDAFGAPGSHTLALKLTYWWPAS